MQLGIKQQELTFNLLIFGIFPFFQNTLKNLFTMHLHFGRSIDTNTNLVTLNPQYGNGDIFTNYQLFTYSSREY